MDRTDLLSASRTVEWDLVADGFAFPEGPVSISRDADCGGGPNGAALGPDGNLYVCNNGGLASATQAPSVQKVHPVTREVSVVVESCDGRALTWPNDLVFDDVGGFWFTDTGRGTDDGGILYATVDREVVHRVVEGISLANGIALSPEGDRLYVSTTDTGRLLSWPLTAPGRLEADGTSVGGSTMVWDFGGAALFDGMAIEADGSICVTTLQPAGVAVFSPAGELLEWHMLPPDDVVATNICFARENSTSAFVTAGDGGRLYRASWPRPGAALRA